MNTYMLTYLHAYLHTYIHTCIHTYRQTDRRTDGRTDGRTDLPTYLPTYLPNYLPTYIHTYIHRSQRLHQLHTDTRANMRMYVHGCNVHGWGSVSVKPKIFWSLCLKNAQKPHALTLVLEAQANDEKKTHGFDLGLSSEVKTKQNRFMHNSSNAKDLPSPTSNLGKKRLSIFINSSQGTVHGRLFLKKHKKL